MDINYNINNINIIMSNYDEYFSNLLEKNICNINYKEKLLCKGFFCRINFMPICENLPVLIINSYLFNKDEEIFIDEKINIALKNKNTISLVIDESRKMYTEKEKYGLTIIEIKKDDGLDIHSFFELDSNIMQNKSEIIYNNNIINLFFYSFEQKPVKMILGIIKNINSINQIIDFCSIDKKISLGSPIINNNNKIIGIIKSCDSISFKTIGIFLKGAIKEFINETLENKNIITIIYKNILRKKIILFGKGFIALNKNNCKMIINGKEKEISQFDIYLNEIKENKEIKFLKIKLKIIEKLESLDSMFSGCDTLYALPDLSKIDTANIISFKQMFDGCSSLTKLSDLSKWDTKNVKNLRNMFNDCSSLIEVPDISKWDISRVKDISFLFSKCLSLIKIPDISKWNTCNITLMIGVFNECPLVNELPDISKWNTNSVIDISYMFCECTSLTSLPDISKWYTGNVTYMNQLFSICQNLKHIPDISIWNTNNVNNMMNMFEYCSSLKNLPDISKWNTKNVNDMKEMFKNCFSLKELPDISNWNTKKVTVLKGMFLNCYSLKTLPDISKWNTKCIKHMNYVFNGCSSLIAIPDISKWDTSDAFRMDYLFSKCSSLSILPDISKWNTEKVTNIDYIFNECASLSKVPDISKWKLQNSIKIKMTKIFKSCISLVFINNFHRYNNYKNEIIDECISLLNTK